MDWWRRIGIIIVEVVSYGLMKNNGAMKIIGIIVTAKVSYELMKRNWDNSS